MRTLGPQSPPREVTIQDATRIGARLMRVRIGGPAFAGLPFLPGQQLRVEVGPATPEGPELRTYSLWNYSPERGSGELLVHLHGGGPGSRWAEAAKPGDSTVVYGPAGSFVVARHARHHVFVGDETCLGPMLSMAGALPEGATASMVLSVEDESDLVPCEIPGVSVAWVLRRGGPATSAAPLVAALDHLTLPEGAPTVAYLGGEMGVCMALRDHLLATGRFARKDLRVKPFWTPERVGLT